MWRFETGSQSMAQQILTGYTVHESQIFQRMSSPTRVRNGKYGSFRSHTVRFQGGHKHGSIGFSEYDDLFSVAKMSLCQYMRMRWVVSAVA